jgi:uncharacterized protein YegP (UPF0339 family)
MSASLPDVSLGDYTLSSVLGVPGAERPFLGLSWALLLLGPKTTIKGTRTMFFKLFEEATPDGTQWTFSIKTDRHAILAQSPSYASREAALAAIDTIKNAAASARIEDHGAEGLVGHP